ncbi:MAG: hypothetical protein OXB88_09815 [Bacteriovoracales bacterium]|nr:hypothetical protein [Bacteriovoracales bacterium]
MAFHSPSLIEENIPYGQVLFQGPDCQKIWAFFPTQGQSLEFDPRKIPRGIPLKVKGIETYTDFWGHGFLQIGGKDPDTDIMGSSLESN